ncbi:MAG: FkbM family methyltransferase, partial [Cyanobacteria bacterium P01_G01_bin.49]
MSLFVNELKKQNRLQDLQFLICIVGSRQLSSTEGRSWTALEPNLTILGFDADEDACDQDNARLAQQPISWTERYIPLALSDKVEEKTLYVTNAVHCSSLYPPNEALLSRFMGMKDGIKLDFTIDLPTTTLEQFCQDEDIQQIDFLQVDVQGADFDVLKGAGSLLDKTVLGLQIEVEFAKMYQNQPLFPEIDQYCQTQGFALFDLITKDGWCRRPRACSPIFSSQRIGQLLWADALYLRDPIHNEKSSIWQSPTTILKLACIADVLDYPDYAMELLLYLTLKYGDDQNYNFASEILSVLSQFPELAKGNIESLPIVQ